MSSGWHYEVGQPRLEATLQVLPPDGADWVEHDDLDPDKQGDSTVPSNRMELHFFSATSAGQRFQVTRRPDVCVTAYPKEGTAIVAPAGTVHRFIDYERPAADLPRMRLHDMRHTHASLMLKAGENTKVVTERLGHSTAAYTQDAYQHVLPGMQRDAATRFQDASTDPTPTKKDPHDDTDESMEDSA